MSIGGTIIDIVKVHDHKWWINTFDAHTECAVFVDPDGELLQVGDALWWQGHWAMWTPRMKPDGRTDVKLRRIGYSGVEHPDKRPIT
jgi:hypothetical protein